MDEPVVVTARIEAKAGREWRLGALARHGGRAARRAPRGLLLASRRRSDRVVADRRRRRIVAALCLAWLCGGCAAKVQQAYEGPERPSQDVAALSGSAHRLFLLFYNRTFFIVPAALDETAAQSGTAEWALLAGPHTVLAVYGKKQLWMLGAAFFLMGRPLQRQTVAFTAQAGHRYRVDGHIIEPAPGAQRFCAWVEDEESGEVVGGAKHCLPPSPSPEPTPEPTPGPT